jgi:transcription initiation factor TFIID subunit 1
MHYSTISSGAQSVFVAFEHDEPNEDLREAIKEMEMELKLAPWNLSKNFVDSQEGRSTLQLTGPGDPSAGRAEGFSYLKPATKSRNRRRRRKRERER